MLSPRSVLVTGANRGIGLEFIEQLANLNPKPKHVFAACRNPDCAKALKELSESNPNVSIIKIDVEDQSTIATAKAVVEDQLEGEGLNLLINNAGIGIKDELENVETDTMIELFRINTVGPVKVSQIFLPLLKKAASQINGSLSCSRAAIVNISTGMASIGEDNTGLNYSYRCSKAALNMATKNMSIDLKDHGILVSALHPGWVKTDLGGSGAMLEVSDSVQSLISLMADLSTGSFLHYSGRPMAW